MKTLKVIAAIAALVAVTAHADKPKIEWRLLGPAVAWHSDNDGAPKRTYVDAPTPAEVAEKSMWICEVNSNPGIKIKTAKLLTESESGFCIQQTANPSALVQRTTAPGWHNTNPAIGIERSARYSDRVDKVYAGLVKDSYGELSAMAGVSRMWPLSSGRFKFDAGVTGMLWYRTVGIFADGSLDRKVVPLVMPALSISDSVSGFGVNVAYLPELIVSGKKYNTHTLMLQSTYKF